MICPNCKHAVDPVCDSEWYIHLDRGLDDDRRDPVKVVLEAIHLWDESTMNCGGQSTLPTELRDALNGVLSSKPRRQS